MSLFYEASQKECRRATKRTYHL